MHYRVDRKAGRMRVIRGWGNGSSVGFIMCTSFGVISHGDGDTCKPVRPIADASVTRLPLLSSQLSLFATLPVVIFGAPIVGESAQA